MSYLELDATRHNLCRSSGPRDRSRGEKASHSLRIAQRPNQKNSLRTRELHHLHQQLQSWNETSQFFVHLLLGAHTKRTSRGLSRLHLEVEYTPPTHGRHFENLLAPHHWIASRTRVPRNDHHRRILLEPEWNAKKEKRGAHIRENQARKCERIEMTSGKGGEEDFNTTKTEKRWGWG